MTKTRLVRSEDCSELHKEHFAHHHNNNNNNNNNIALVLTYCYAHAKASWGALVTTSRNHCAGQTRSKMHAN